MEVRSTFNENKVFKLMNSIDSRYVIQKGNKSYKNLTTSSINCFTSFLTAAMRRSFWSVLGSLAGISSEALSTEKINS